MEADEEQLRATGGRIEELLTEIRSTVNERAWAEVEELVRLLTDLYGAGLARTIQLAGEGEGLLARLAADELVGSLLLLHGLHPEDLAGRVQRAVDAVAPALRARGGQVEISGIDPPSATVDVRLSTPAAEAAANRDQLERALADAAPDATVRIEQVVDAAVAVRLGPTRLAAGVRR